MGFLWRKQSQYETSCGSYFSIFKVVLVTWNWPQNQWNPCPIIECPTNQHCQHHKTFIFGSGGLNLLLILWTIFPFHPQRLADEYFASWRSLACWGNCQVLVFFWKVKHARPHYWAKKQKKSSVSVDKAPRLNISIVICILSSDTETSAATPLGGGARKVLAK